MRKLIVSLVVFVFMSALSAADLTGKWTGSLFEVNHENEGRSALLILKQSGSELTGSAGPNEEKQFPITSGKVDGDKITFDVAAEDATMHFELMASGNRLTGSVRGEHEGETKTAKVDVTRSE